MHRWYSIGLIAFALLVTVVLTRAFALKSPDVPTYRYTEVTRIETPSRLFGTGRLVTSKMVDVGAGVSGHVEQVFADVLDHVEKEQLLADQLDEMQLVADVDAHVADQIIEGQSAAFTVAAHQGQTYRGIVREVRTRPPSGMSPFVPSS